MDLVCSVHIVTFQLEFAIVTGVSFKSGFRVLSLYVQVMRQYENTMHPAQPRFAWLGGVHNKVNSPQAGAFLQTA